MSNDFQFITMVDELAVRLVEDLVGAEPRTLRVSGISGFLSTQRVFINNYGVDDFIIISDSVLLVYPSDVFSSVAVENMSVQVASGELTGASPIRILFGPTKKTRAVSGIQKLVQQVIKMLLSDIGSNRFDPGEGGDLVHSLGLTLGSAGSARISASLSQAVRTVEEQLVSSQAAESNLPASERLLSLSLSGLRFDNVALSVEADIRLVTFTGAFVQVPLVL